MVTDSERQAIIDQEHLRLLPVAYWVLGAFDIFVGMYGSIYVGLGIVFAAVPFSSSSDLSSAPPAFFPYLFIGIGAVFMLAFGVLATLKILTGFWIRKRKHRTACLVIAGLTCASVPFGTMVGVLTFLVLLRPSVSALFAVSAAPATTDSAEGTVG